MATILFSVHPVHTEAVCGIVSRSDLVAALLFLLCGIFYFFVFHKGDVVVVDLVGYYGA